ncbi:serine/threonine protein kinase [Hokovirus HKV1]|uniref:Serine/threonine protein kinase n=1 Tax=Hokovirus HKV1 TaxID=1977638 RepID=A0A1V0SF99_9VIRU|nr:serine/threonine protein kinase [Hokovirus HKV1]
MKSILLIILFLSLISSQELGKKIGKGFDGNVYEIINNDKIVAKHYWKLDYDKFQDEVFRWEQIPDHENVFKMLYHHPEIPLALFERVKCDLDNYLIKNINNFNNFNDYELHIIEIFKQIVSGIMHIHSYGFSHCDIKPANIFVSKTDLLVSNTIKVADLSRLSFTKTGLESYGLIIPPESINGQPFDLQKADIYNLGAILYNLLHKQDIKEQYAKICAPNMIVEYTELFVDKLYFSSHVSEKVILLIKKMLSYDPNSRPNIIEIMSFLVFL